MIEVVQPGALATVQDRGRVGYAHLGVPRSGAADMVSHDLANRLVGNEVDAATIEVTLGGATLRFNDAHAFAVTGAQVQLVLDGRQVDMGQWYRASAGDVLEIGVGSHGVRAYIAVSGGIDVPPVLGSRSTDTLSGLGPPRLSPGTLLPVGGSRHLPIAASDVAVGRVALADDITLAYRRGPRDAMFTDSAFERLERHAWHVTGQSDRVAVRLDGPGLERAVAGDIPSEGMVLGAIQVPESGRPIVFLADHPATGGYPVLGVVEPADVAALAQARPGSTVRFTRYRPPR